MEHLNNFPKDIVAGQCIGINLFLHPGLRLLMAWWGKCEIGAMHTVQSEILHSCTVYNPNLKLRLYLNNCPVPLRLCLLLYWFIHPGLLVSSV